MEQMSSAAVQKMIHAGETRHIAARALEFLERQAPGSAFAKAAEDALSGPVALDPHTALGNIAVVLNDWATFVEEGMASVLPYEARARVDAATDLMEQVQRLLEDKDI